MTSLGKALSSMDEMKPNSLVWADREVIIQFVKTVREFKKISDKYKHTLLIMPQSNWIIIDLNEHIVDFGCQQLNRSYDHYFLFKNRHAIETCVLCLGLSYENFWQSNHLSSCYMNFREMNETKKKNSRREWVLSKNIIKLTYTNADFLSMALIGYYDNLFFGKLIHKNVSVHVIYW